MKQLLLLILLHAGMLCYPPCMAQDTKFSKYDISINGLEFGEIYAINQFKKALGEPTKIDSSYSEFGGWVYQIRYENELTIRFSTIPEINNCGNTGIESIIIKDPKYPLHIYGTDIKVGEPFSKIESIEGYTGTGEGIDNFTRIFFFDMKDVDPSLEVMLSEEGIITVIDFSARYY